MHYGLRLCTVEVKYKPLNKRSNLALGCTNGTNVNTTFVSINTGAVYGGQEQIYYRDLSAWFSPFPVLSRSFSLARSDSRKLFHCAGWPRHVATPGLSTGIEPADGVLASSRTPLAGPLMGKALGNPTLRRRLMGASLLRRGPKGPTGCSQRKGGPCPYHWLQGPVSMVPKSLSDVWNAIEISWTVVKIQWIMCTDQDMRL